KADNPPLSTETAWSLIEKNDSVVGAMNRVADEYVAYRARNDMAVYNLMVEFYTHVLRMNPFPQHYLERAGFYRALGKYDRALEDLNQAIQRDKKNAVLFFNRARVHKLLKKYEEAVEDLHAAEEILPTGTLGADDRFLFYSTMGVCLARLDRHEEAIEMLTGA